jgi:hypothetical protein
VLKLFSFPCPVLEGNRGRSAVKLPGQRQASHA